MSAIVAHLSEVYGNSDTKIRWQCAWATSSSCAVRRPRRALVPRGCSEGRPEAAFAPNEIEGISPANLPVNGQLAQVHVLELNSDNHSGDVLYLWHVKVPWPDHL